jgi:hypothetical protein
MNGISYHDLESRFLCDGLPPQGLSEARRAERHIGIFPMTEFFGLRIRRGGAPSGAAAFIAPEKQSR